MTDEEKKELESKEKLAEMVALTNSRLDTIEKSTGEDRKEILKKSEVKALLAKIAEDVEKIDKKQTEEEEARVQRATDIKLFNETTTATIKELEKMYAQQFRPGMVSKEAKEYDIEERENLFYKALIWRGLEHGSYPDTYKRNFELSPEEVNRYRELSGTEMKSLTPGVEIKEMTTHNLTRAGVMTVPATIVQETLDTAKVVTTNIRPYARNWRVATKEMEVSLMTAHGIVSAAYEGGTMGEDETQAFGSQSIHLHKYYHRFHLTHEMIKFGYPGLIPMLKKDQGEAFSLKLGTAHTSGTGAGEPEGVLVNSSIPTVNLEETTSITTGDYLSRGYFTLKEIYADRARWMMKRLTLWELSILKGSDGHPLLVQLRDKPDFLFMGAPIIQSPDMPAVASAAKPIILADFNSLYGTLDWTGTTINIVDPFTSKATGIVEYLTVMWFGGAVLIPEAGIIFVASVT